MPRNVRTAFERARCAYLYAWFSYELTTLAQAQACAALELALKQHLRVRYPNGDYRHLNGCFEKTIADGDFAGFRVHAAEPEYDKVRLGYLKELLVHVRNDVAHGSEMVMMPGQALDIIVTCARLIDHIHGWTPTVTAAGGRHV